MCPMHNDLEDNDQGLFDFSLAESAESAESAKSAKSPPETPSFRFRAKMTLQREGRLEHFLGQSRLLLFILALLSLLLLFTPLSPTIVWSIFAVLLALAIISWLFLVVRNQTWQRELVEVDLSFTEDEVYLTLPEESSEDFTFSENPDIRDGKLTFTLSPDSILEQAYLTSERAMQLTFSIREGQRVLTLAIPLAELSNETRGRLETEIFNRCGRSLRVISA